MKAKAKEEKQEGKLTEEPGTNAKGETTKAKEKFETLKAKEKLEENTGTILASSDPKKKALLVSIPFSLCLFTETKYPGFD